MGKIKQRNILLLEPNYKNKYPPIGLMKLATYHRMLGDNVMFYKGDLKGFIINEICEELIIKLSNIDNSVNWLNHKKLLKEFIKTGRKEYFKELCPLSKYELLISNWLIYYRNYFKKKEYLKNPKWDRVCISTLFTFFWNVTIDTIEFSKTIVKDKREIFIGGVLATVLADDLEKATGIKPIKGLLNNPGVLDNDNNIIIDELPLDYSILDEIEYKYPESDAYYGYMTRGCVRKCTFCAVWKIEPKFNHYISLIEKLQETKSLFGDKRNLLLLDNNVLASKQFGQIIEEIKKAGFFKGAKFIEPNYLDIAIGNLKKGINEKAFIKKTFELFHNLLNKLKGNKQQEFYSLLAQTKLLDLNTATKDNILLVYSEVEELYEKIRNKTPKSRYVDFNQGVDARLITEERMKLLSEIAIHPLRIAFDSISQKEVYDKSVRLAAKYEIKNLSNYLLYNEKDKPQELYERLEINILLSEELGINIYSFPMKFHPITGGKHLNRNFLGEHWNRKYIRAIQTILNSTKGKIGRGPNFFYEAFGKNLEEFNNILIMPEPYILYRFFFKDMGFTEKWQNEYLNLTQRQKEIAVEIIKTNDFVKVESRTNDRSVISFLKEHYLLKREDINNSESEIFKLKKEYDIRRSKNSHLNFAKTYKQSEKVKKYILPFHSEPHLYLVCETEPKV
jgi:hypothetical protein